MSVPDCIAIVEQITRILGSADGRIEFKRLVDERAPPEEIAEALARRCEGATAETLLQEFRDLPGPFVPMLMTAWSAAEAAGETFELASRPPERPIEQARRQRVTFTVEYSDSGVVMHVSHVAGRYASWYQSKQLVA